MTTPKPSLKNMVAAKNLNQKPLQKLDKSDRQWYDNQYLNGIKFGKGTYLFADRAKFSANGLGRVNLPNGDIYIGQLQHGKYHGKGTYVTLKAILRLRK